jgi:hypothetical protein
MPVLSGDRHVTIIGEDALRAALSSIRYVIALQRKRRLPYPRDWDELDNALTTALAGCPHRPPTDRTEHHAPQNEWVSTAEAAEYLGCTPRHARRLAPTLDGDNRNGHWLIPKSAINEHIEGTT